MDGRELERQRLALLNETQRNIRAAMETLAGYARDRLRYVFQTELGSRYFVAHDDGSCLRFRFDPLKEIWKAVRPISGGVVFLPQATVDDIVRHTWDRREHIETLLGEGIEIGECRPGMTPLEFGEFDNVAFHIHDNRIRMNQPPIFLHLGHAITHVVERPARTAEPGWLRAMVHAPHHEDSRR